jgi:hypothetical protein
MLPTLQVPRALCQDMLPFLPYPNYHRLEPAPYRDLCEVRILGEQTPTSHCLGRV